MVQFGDEPESRNVEDRRGMSFGGKAGLGGIGTIVIILLALFLGVDPRTLLSRVRPDRPAAAGRHKPHGR